MPKVIVTSGPTREKIDPVRYISNYSSGKQGHSIAYALAQKGFDVTLISGPVSIPDPENVKAIHVESASEMLAEVEKNLPADIAVFVAAVSDWRVETFSPHKLKKTADENSMQLKLVKNPDILATISKHKQRPKLVIGFAAETDNLQENAIKKLNQKACDWIIANNVGQGVFGQNENQVSIIKKDYIETWSQMSKQEVAEKLVQEILKVDKIS